MGRTVSFNEFTDICGALEAKGAENINIVTGSHAAPVLAEALKTARKQGLLIPVLWNSSAYEGLEALSVLEDQIDVYLPDLKTLDPAISRRFFKAPDYPDRAVEAIFRMLKYRGDLRFAPARGGGNGQVLVSGVVIRHLALPGYLEATREVIRWFADHAQGRALLSLMTQYTPAGSGAEPDNTGGSAGRAPDRYINQEEYEKVLLWLEEFGIEDGFYQELVQDNEWLPDFREKNPFSSALSVPVWHWRDGFVDQ
jgi:putative pyruvate formate lyase activating enzyme